MSGPNIGTSVRQRLLNHSRAQERPFQELLQYFAMERFLYRISKSAHADRFVLKGVLLTIIVRFLKRLNRTKPLRISPAKK